MQKEWEVVEKAQKLYKGFTKRFMYENYLKKIDAFLKINNLPLDKEQQYFKKYSESEFDELIKKHYTIKGDVTYQSILKAKKKTDKNVILSEYEEQKKLVKWLRDNKIKCQSSGNGFKLDTKDNMRYMAKLKATGLSIGYNDIDVFIGKGKTLHIEMKRIKGGTISDEQKRWIDWFNENGYKAKVCYGADEAIEWVKEELEKLK